MKLNFGIFFFFAIDNVNMPHTISSIASASTSTLSNYSTLLSSTKTTTTTTTATSLSTNIFTPISHHHHNIIVTSTSATSMLFEPKLHSISAITVNKFIPPIKPGEYV